MEQLSSSKPKAIKDHICNGCRLIIKKGEEYLRYSTADNGTVITTKLCNTCVEYWGIHGDDYDDGWGIDGQLRNDAYNCCEECAHLRQEWDNRASNTQPREAPHD